MKYVEITVKQALSRSYLSDVEYSLNPYVGCEHGCLYCYAPYVTRRDPKVWSDIVYVKRNLPNLLEKELKHKKGPILLSSVTDPYQPAETKYMITRYSLEVMKRFNVDLSILTKSSNILRDMDLITTMKKVQVGVTITTLDENLKSKIEPKSSPVSERLKVLKEFAGSVPAYVMLAPLFSTVFGELEKMFSIFSELGVMYVIVDRFRAKPGMVEFLKDNGFDSALLEYDYPKILAEIQDLGKRYELQIY